MGAQPDSDADPRVAEQAAEWLVRLDSQDCTEADPAAFEYWQAADPMHAVAYRQAQAQWHDSHAVIRNSIALRRAARHDWHDAPERSVTHWGVNAAYRVTALVRALDT